MTTNRIIWTGVLLMATAYAGIFFYQRYQRKKADEAVDSYEEAIKKLQSLK
jgi:predicted negative regulator of RcsB-dependent stress response